MPEENIEDIMLRELRRMREEAIRRRTAPITPPQLDTADDGIRMVIHDNTEPMGHAWDQQYYHSYSISGTTPIRPKKVKHIPPDEKGKAMNNINLTAAEISAMRCDNIIGHFNKKYSATTGGLRAINAPITFNRVEYSMSKGMEIKHYTGIIIGYRVNNKSFTNREEARAESAGKVEITYLVAALLNNAVINKENKIKFLLVNSLNGNVTDVYFHTFLSGLKIRVCKADLSSRLFGLAKAKEDMVGQVFSNYTIEYGNSKKLAADTYYINIQVEDKSYKFCLADIDFILPDSKGYNYPKEKSIVVNSIVKVKNNKDCPQIAIGETLLVTNVKPNKYSKRVQANSQTRQLDTIVGLTRDNREIRIYAKNLKLISNDSNSTSQGQIGDNPFQTNGTIQASNAFRTQG